MSLVFPTGVVRAALTRAKFRLSGVGLTRPLAKWESRVRVTAGAPFYGSEALAYEQRAFTPTKRARYPTEPPFPVPRPFLDYAMRKMNLGFRRLTEKLGSGLQTHAVGSVTRIAFQF